MLLRKMKKDYEEWIENINARSIWDAHRFASALVSDRAKTRILALKKLDINGNTVKIQDNEGKSRFLHETFFYEPPQEPGINPNYQYPEPAFKIRNDEVKRAIKKLKPYKAPGLNEISNSVLTHCINELTPYLGLIYRAVFKHRHYPEK